MLTGAPALDILTFALLASSALPPVVPAATPIDHAAVFEQFKALEGTYEEIGMDGAPARVEYRLISRGTALTETWYMPVGKEELTVFHMDNGTLVATHYCASNMQSTMTLGPSADGGDQFPFQLRSISNQADPDAAHNSAFGYSFDRHGHIHRSEEWTTGGNAVSEMMSFKRVSD